MIIRWTYAFADRPTERPTEARAFWPAVTGTRASRPRGEQGVFLTLPPQGAAGTDACVKLQGVAEGDGGDHLDLWRRGCTGVDRSGPGTRRGAGGGPRRPGRTAVSGGAVVLSRALARGGGTAAGGGGSRLDRGCLDIPPSAYAAESDFGAGLTGWERLTGRGRSSRC
ncbi:hypothetical protein SRB17_27930 [Streptomyces sp. RB17]|nr:hypothetical protein [Streptomyces sp. RB17]